VGGSVDLKLNSNSNLISSWFFFGAQSCKIRFEKTLFFSCLKLISCSNDYCSCCCLLLLLLLLFLLVVSTHLWRYIWRWLAIRRRGRWFPPHLASTQDHSWRWHIFIHIVVTIHVGSVVAGRQQRRLLILQNDWTLVANFRFLLKFILEDNWYALCAERLTLLLITCKCFKNYISAWPDENPWFRYLPSSILPLLWRRRCKQQAIIEANNIITTIMTAGSINVAK